PVRFAPGEVLLREGERGDDAFLIRVGQVEVVRGEGAQQRALSTLGPGSFVGEVSALTGGPRTATVRAKTAVQAFRLPGEDVRPVVRKHRLLVGRLETSMQARHAPRRVGSATVEAAPDEARAVILRDANAGTYLRLTHEALAIYEDLNGERTLRDLALGGVVVAFVGLFMAGLGHETAHALATKAEGRRVGRAGIGLLWFTPVIYVDTSDAWLIDRRHRAVVNAAGPLFNFALAGVL